MPNWVRNVLNLQGPEEEIRKFKELVTSKDRAFDLDKVIHKPKELEIESGSVTWASLAVFKHLIHVDSPDWEQIGKTFKWNKELVSPIGFIKSLIDGRRVDLNVGFQAYCNELTYGYPDWYYWSCANWGTKWNTADSIATAEGFEFDTAWSPPLPIIEKLHTLFPKVKMHLYWADECEQNDQVGEAYYSDKEEENFFICPAADDTKTRHTLYEKCWGCDNEDVWQDCGAGEDWDNYGVNNIKN